MVAPHPEPTDAATLAQDAWDYCITPLLPVDEIRAGGLHIYKSGEGVRLTDYDGNTYLDMMSSHTRANSLGYGNAEIAQAVADQLSTLHYVGTVSNFAEPTIRLAKRIAEKAPGDLSRVLFVSGGSEAVEAALKMAKQYQVQSGNKPRAYKVISRWNAYHGATMGAMTLTGDPRRWANEPGLVGVVRYPDTHRWGEAEPRPVGESLQGLEDVIRYEGPNTIAAVCLETVVGTNGILIPPDGYIQGVREICDRHGILMVADEVMAGFGRTGRWFAIDHWDTVPDLMTMAKGLTSSYLPLGAVAMRHHIAQAFEDKMFYGGLTYSSHPVSLAASLATIGVYEEDGLIENAARLDRVMRDHHQRLAAKHRSVGATRNLGLFGILDLVRSHDPWTPLTPFNGTSDEMKAIGKYLREHGVYAMIANNSIHTNPPLCITEDELAQGFDVIDAALDIADQAVTG